MVETIVGEKKQQRGPGSPTGFRHLLSPARIGNITVRNRMVMPPMGTNYASDDGFVTERLVRYYEARAEGGTGLIIVEVAAVAPEGKAITHQIGIWADKFIPGLRYLAESIRKHGARAAIQLHHAGRQTTFQTTGYQPVAPSEIPCPICRDMPRSLTIEEIKGIVEAFGHAARRAREAGFDAVEIHGTHGYLINQFLSPYSNKRTDEYGGSPAGRRRFPIEVYDAVRAAVGGDFPVIFRMNADEGVEGGITPEEGREFAGLLEKAGVDALHVSGGVYGSPLPIIATMYEPEPPLAHYAAGIRARVTIPVIAVGKIHDPEIGEQLIAGGKADFVSLGRGLITDSHFARKVELGQVKNIRKCIECNQLCVDPLLVYGQPVGCIYNARAGKEHEFPFVRARRSKKVVVVGGGPAGLEAARVARERGHQVVLFERSSELGGQGRLALKPPHKERFGEILRYLIYRVETLDVDIRLNSAATEDKVMREKPDAVILATGAVPLIPALPGIDPRHAITAWDVLEEKVRPGRHVAIIGGGLVGCETAAYLAEGDRRVIILEMQDELAPDQSPSLRGELLRRLHENPAVEIRTSTEVVSIGEHSITLRSNNQESAIEDLDTIVIAAGAQPYNPLEGILKPLMNEVYAVGDCDRPRKAAEAIHEAFHVAYRL
ncbi:MAG TPA: FAD-dependent oxidoreductase [Bacillota bacterium]|nr:FAD-dependent oxidoreductase [Bacillota bacterium]HQE09745.1 FAD-dependent oxidoreductase [Bacillota bacterium]